MRYILAAVLMVLSLAAVLHAEDKNFEPKDKFCVIEKTPSATSPIGAVIETAGVFAGKIASATEVAFTGERKITVENETGECRIFPFGATTKVVDKTFRAITFNKLKEGQAVKVKYTGESDGMVAEEVIVEK
ncbi:MAG: hypothetical protein JXB40_03730 [Candidatus Omnitrophica bacterium]|nr:hypothetical protein [Candidatus Omnitrophota bacterium]